MTSIEYTKIFDNFLGNITDLDFVNLSMTDSFQLMTEQLHKAVIRPHIKKIFSSVKLDDEIMVLSFELKRSEGDDALDKDFVALLLSKAMVYEWVSPQVNSGLLTKQALVGKEQSMYSQANHLTTLMALQKSIDLEIRSILVDRGYVSNDYLDGLA